MASVCLGTYRSVVFNFLNYMFGSGSLIRVQYPKCSYGPNRVFNQIENGVYILVEVSIRISITW